MTLNLLMFYLLSAVILGFSVMTITTGKMLRAAVYLLFVLVATAGLYFLLNYEFLAAVQLTLYAGGIVVLIIFSILLTSHISQRFERPSAWKLWIGAITLIGGSTTVLWVLLSSHFEKAATVTELPVDMHVIGEQLLGTGKNGYVLPFELISILLLAAMIVAIVIAKKEKNQN
ncbi:MAG: NADH-quinone oxidoreductase subunit J [Bacteroidales bacterium]|nr:NADH-quinone oxidoreductase subunit J [Bacteroidales bacterium]